MSPAALALAGALTWIETTGGGRRTGVGADRLALLAEMADGFGGGKVEDSAAGSDPAAAAPGEDGRRAAQVADRRQALHVAARDRLEGNRHRHKREDLAAA